MKQEKEIKDFGVKQPGMSVPYGYFADFSSRMNELIDEECSTGKETIQVSFWQKVKPWMYLAAMFVSFVVVFRVLIGPVSDSERMAALQQTEEQALVEDALFASLSDYDVYEYLYAGAE
ncbi:MAG: hypothetical protein ACRCSQ_08280 [Bacteroidales bacterium]